MKEVYLRSSYYASLSWHVAEKSGLTGDGTDQDFSDDKLLAELAEAFVISPPNTVSDFLPLLFHVPSALDPKSEKELSDVADLIQCAILEGPFDETLQTHSTIGRIWPWNHFIKRFEDRKQEIADLLARYFDFILQSWAEYKSLYESRMQEYPLLRYEGRLQTYDIINTWETAFGIPYVEEDFYAVICVGTPLISLGTNCITYGAQHSFEKLLQAVVHEIGVRIPSLRQLHDNEITNYIARENWNGLVTLTEAETCFRKTIAFPSVFSDGVEDDFSVAMKLEPLLAVRPKEHEDSIYAHYSRWYDIAKERDLLE